MKRALVAVVMTLTAAAHAQEGAVEPLGARYVLDDIEVHGNEKTRASVITNALFLHPGDVVTADDPRKEPSRFRLLGLGLFEDVQLSLKKGSERGHVILVVEVVERGTLILNEIFLGTSEATTIWAGLDVGENNFLGHGISVSAAAVAGSQADVQNATSAQGFRLRLWDPDVRGWGIGLGGEVLYNHGSEFFRSAGASDDANPKLFVASQYRRVGGQAGGSFDLGRIAHVRITHRAEWLDASFPQIRSRTLPNGELEPIDFLIDEGTSLLSVFGVMVDFDTRDDPVSPEHGFRLALDGQLATRLWGSDYDYGRLTVAYDHFNRLPWRHHVLAVHLFGGVIVGAAPFFEQFFVGDLNRLLPPRALGLNFSTQPSRALLGLDAIRDQRYDPIAGRAAIEYVIPLFRGHKLVYAGDFFALAGIFTLTSFDDLRQRDTSLGDALPFDLTFDIGVRLDTSIGIFSLSAGNAIGRLPL
jgi:outer membrane protein assembly factor BamA